jgi:ABC-type antimicrobial peptide transport system permease subunit
MAATLLSIFGLLALSLAAIGLYGVMAYAVSQRTRELGIRISVGAERRDIFKLILGQGLAISVVGLLAGMVAALPLTRLTARCQCNRSGYVHRDRRTALGRHIAGMLFPGAPGN